MSAELINIGTPRAFGQALGRKRMPYAHPYTKGSSAAKAFTSGFFEGDMQKDETPLIIAPDAPADDGPKVA